ncbi:MAG: PTS sugar transporter subunit IIA, partial [Gammaproteobacteria bacterium]|nr:PTS sugar transporter subunit IIA [Gammaproteobacteria bacterium]
KQVLQQLCDAAAKLSGLSPQDVFATVLQRERLGSTGVGHGIAIPHGKFAGIDRLYGLFAKLEKPIDFDAMDDQPVDLIFLLLAPESAGADHLKALARVSRLLRDPGICAKLRGSTSPEAIYSLITEPAASHAA